MEPRTPEQIRREEELRRQQDGLDADTNMFAKVIEMIGKFFETIFGAFTDEDSEYSEIDRSQAAPSPSRGGIAGARAFIDRVGDGTLRRLAAQYAGVDMPNISPFRGNATITSGLGHRDIAVGSHKHKGLDLVPQDGDTRVFNTMPGVVVRSETQRDRKGNPVGFGNWVEVACIDGTRRRYAHLAALGAPVGTVLLQGDPIGIMGNTGTGTGPHLHYEWRDARGNLLEPDINGRVYRNEDKSYVRSTVTPSAPVRMGAAAAVPAAAPEPVAPVAPVAAAPARSETPVIEPAERPALKPVTPAKPVAIAAITIPPEITRLKDKADDVIEGTMTQVNQAADRALRAVKAGLGGLGLRLA